GTPRLIVQNAAVHHQTADGPARPLHLARRDAGPHAIIHIPVSPPRAGPRGDPPKCYETGERGRLPSPPTWTLLTLFSFRTRPFPAGGESADDGDVGGPPAFGILGQFEIDPLTLFQGAVP